MEKKEKSVLMAIMACAVLGILVLYSPVGSPDLYMNNSNSNNYSVSYFGKIQNAPKESNTNQNNNLVLPTAAPKLNVNIETTNPTIGIANASYSIK